VNALKNLLTSKHQYVSLFGFIFTCLLLTCTISEDNGDLAISGPNLSDEDSSAVDPGPTITDTNTVEPAFIIVREEPFLAVGDTQTITITAVEAATLGDTISGETRLSGLPVLVSTNRGTISADTIVTDANGRGRITFTDSTQGQVEILFTYRDIIRRVRFDVTDTPDQVQRLMNILPQKPVIKADAVARTEIYVTIIDSNHNPIVGEAIQFIASSGVISGATPPSEVKSGQAITNSDGVAIANLVSSNINDTSFITAYLVKDPSMSVETQVAFNGVTIQVETNSPNIEVDESVTVTALVLNGSEQPIVNAPVFFSLSGGSSSNLTVTSNDTATGFDGRASITLNGDATGTETIRVISSGASSNININVTNLVLTIRLQAKKLTASAESIDTAYVQFANNNGTALSNKQIRLVRHYPLEDESPAVDTMYDTTNSSGEAVFEIPPVLHDAIVRLEVTGINSSTDIASAEETIEYLTTRSILVNAIPTMVQADGTSRSKITVLVKNENNNALAGETVRFSCNAGVVSASAVTDEFGKAIGYLTSDRRNTIATVAVTLDKDPTKTDTVDVEFVGVKVTSNISPRSISSSGEDTSLISITLVDAAGNAIAGENVTFREPQNSNTYVRALQNLSDTDPTSTLTNNRGEASCKVWGTGSGEQIITIVTGAGTTTDAKITYSNNLLVIDTLSGQSYLADSNVTTAITVKYTEGDGTTALANVPVDVSVTMGDLGAVFATVCTTGTDGMDTITISNPNFSSTATIAAEAQTSSEITSADFQIYFKANNIHRIELVGTPEVITTDGDRARIIATVFDSLGNRVSNAKISFNMLDGPGGGEHLDPPVAVTRLDGTAETYLVSGTIPSMYHEVSVAAGDFTGYLSKSVLFTIVGPPYSITINRDIGEATDNDDGTYTMACAALVSDVNGNPVADGTPVTFSMKVTGYRIFYVRALAPVVYDYTNQVDYYYPYDTASRILPFEDLNDNFRLDPGEDRPPKDGIASRGEDVNGDGKIDESLPYIDINRNGERDYYRISSDSVSYLIDVNNPERFDIVQRWVYDTGSGSVWRTDTIFADMNGNNLFDFEEPLTEDYDQAYSEAFQRVSAALANSPRNPYLDSSGISADMAIIMARNLLFQQAEVANGGFDIDWNGDGLPSPATAAIIERTVTTTGGKAVNTVTYGQSDALRIRARITAESNGIVAQPHEFILPILAKDYGNFTPFEY